MSAIGVLWAPRLTLINFDLDSISKCACLTVVIDNTKKTTKFVNFSIFDDIVSYLKEILMYILTY